MIARPRSVKNVCSSVPDMQCSSGMNSVTLSNLEAWRSARETASTRSSVTGENR